MKSTHSEFLLFRNVHNELTLLIVIWFKSCSNSQVNLRRQRSAPQSSYLSFYFKSSTLQTPSEYNFSIFVLIMFSYLYIKSLWTMYIINAGQIAPRVIKHCRVSALILWFLGRTQHTAPRRRRWMKFKVDLSGVGWRWGVGVGGGGEGEGGEGEGGGVGSEGSLESSYPGALETHSSYRISDTHTHIHSH